jgi:hypothetical protein
VPTLRPIVPNEATSLFSVSVETGGHSPIQWPSSSKKRMFSGAALSYGGIDGVSAGGS